jgi:hypothetical protein
MRIIATGSNTYKIQFVGGGGNKCLDNPGSQTADGTQMQVWDCLNNSNQNWSFVNVGAGAVMIKNQYSGKCLDVGSSASPDDQSATLQIATCNYDLTTNYNQLFMLTTYN